MGDNDFPAVMANGGGKNFLSGFVKGMSKYSQSGTDIDDFEIERAVSYTHLTLPTSAIV